MRPFFVTSGSWGRSAPGTAADRPRPVARRPSRTLSRLTGALALCLLAACSVPPPDSPAADGVFDPYEPANRRVHAFNKALDRAVLRPVGQGIASSVPTPVQIGLSNVARNLSLPGHIANRLLQGRPVAATRMGLRLTVNTLLGLGGAFDLAGQAGLVDEPTDFGETLHVWGVPEGAYLELPVLGPSTERDAVGTAVGFLFDPLRLALKPSARKHALVVQLLSGVGARGRYADSVDSILYESADSYAQLRLFYLQSRRFELEGHAEEDYISPDEVDTEGF